MIALSALGLFFNMIPGALPQADDEAAPLRYVRRHSQVWGAHSPSRAAISGALAKRSFELPSTSISNPSFQKDRFGRMPKPARCSARSTDRTTASTRAREPG